MEINRISLSEVDSTNNYAAKLILEGKVPHATVISALHQTQGRGQRSNVWKTAAGQNITASWIFHFNTSNFELLVCLNKAISLALRNTISDWLPGEMVQIKWPNDIYVNQNKISGTLIETHMHADKTSTLICGIGINVYQTEFESPKATSLKAVQKDFNRSLDELLVQLHHSLLKALEEYGKQPSGPWLQEYTHLLMGYQQKRNFIVQNQSLAGTVQGVDQWGRLMILTEKGIEYFQAGEIIWQ